MINFFNRVPSISVVMPVYNGSLYLAEAILSILNQNFHDFEFIIVDDGSSDNSVKMINDFKDKRIILKQNKVNQGNYRCRNLGMKIARGKYICVMDSDDISEPVRLLKQFNFMESNSHVGICGSFIKNIPSNLIPRFITDHEKLKVFFLSNNFCSHPSLIIRKEFLDRFKLEYNEEYFYSADFDLCAKGFRFFKILNIPEVLLQYRRHSGQISSAKFSEQTRFADLVRIRQLIDNLGFRLSEIPVAVHLKLMKRQPLLYSEQNTALNWIKKILARNMNSKYYESDYLEQFLISSISNSPRE